MTPKVSIFKVLFAVKGAPHRISANIALNKQEIRITRYIRKRMTVLCQFFSLPNSEFLQNNF